MTESELTGSLKSCKEKKPNVWIDTPPEVGDVLMWVNDPDVITRWWGCCCTWSTTPSVEVGLNVNICFQKWSDTSPAPSAVMMHLSASLSDHWWHLSSSSEWRAVQAPEDGRAQTETHTSKLRAFSDWEETEHAVITLLFLVLMELFTDQPVQDQYRKHRSESFPVCYQIKYSLTLSFNLAWKLFCGLVWLLLIFMLRW